MTAKQLSKIQENISLAPLTTFGVGGPARYFTEVAGEEELLKALAFAGENGLSLLVLGGGSNVLISDRGFPGLVILNRLKGISVKENGNDVIVEVGGGEDWQEFVDLCVAGGWQGVECLAGIPGTVGASPIQNIGAYGQEVSRAISSVRCLEISTGKVVTFANAQCSFNYRESIFNTVAAGKYVVMSVCFDLKRGGKPEIKYRELEERLAPIPSPTLADVRDAVIEIRAGKGVLVREGYESFKSAGSFFKNPIVPAEQFRQVQALLPEEVGSAGWFWPLPNGEVKLSAAFLIQRAGFERGQSKGNAGISPYHTLILINSDGASALEIVTLAAEIQQRVTDLFGVLLKPEARLIGFDPSPL